MKTGIKPLDKTTPLDDNLVQRARNAGYDMSLNLALVVKHPEYMSFLLQGLADKSFMKDMLQEGGVEKASRLAYLVRTAITEGMNNDARK